MSSRRWRLLAATAFLLVHTACFNTKILSGRAPERGTTRTETQWFTLGGLARLSSAPGRECSQGLASAESRYSLMDILIQAGLSVGGGFLGAAVCDDEDDDARAACTAGGATLVPFLLGSRTVEYSCAGGPAGVSLLPDSREGLAPAATVAPDEESLKSRKQSAQSEATVTPGP